MTCIEFVQESTQMYKIYSKTTWFTTQKLFLLYNWIEMQGELYLNII